MSPVVDALKIYSGSITERLGAGTTQGNFFGFVSLDKITVKAQQLPDPGDFSISPVYVELPPKSPHIKGSRTIAYTTRCFCYS